MSTSSASGTPVEVRVVFGAEHGPAALPVSALLGEILLAVDGDVADAAAVGQALLDHGGWTIVEPTTSA